MSETVLQSLEVVARLLEIVGGGALVLGFVVATGLWFRNSVRQGAKQAVGPYRQSLGRAVLIGLEILVAATIIRTITVDPTVEGMGLLVFTVAIRTALGWTTALEMNGRWPWQKTRPIE